MQARLFSNVPYRSTTYTHHFPDKQAGYNGKLQILVLVIKGDFNLK